MIETGEQRLGIDPLVRDGANMKIVAAETILVSIPFESGGLPPWNAPRAGAGPERGAQHAECRAQVRRVPHVRPRKPQLPRMAEIVIRANAFLWSVARHVVLSLAWLLAAIPGRAQDVSVGESIIEVHKPGFLGGQTLETTLFLPDGVGPFPVAVINHGKAPGDTRFQGRYRPMPAVRFFLQRGYAVVVPMRGGFSKSTGSYIGGGCNVESNGRVQAEDVKAVLDHIVQQPWADRERMLVMGQSHGGWTSLAFGALNYPGVRGLVNFAGGLRQVDCAAWEDGLARAVASYARETKIPSLWFYGDNDSYFSPYTYKGMYSRYTAAGGQAKLVAFGVFGRDAHNMFGARAGQSIWQPEMSRFLASLDLPAEVRPEYGKYALPVPMKAPPKTDFAVVDAVDRVPYVKDRGRKGYGDFLNSLEPRAFAIAPNGGWGWANGGDDPLARALENCNKHGARQCRLYAVDGDVVWQP